MSSRLLVILFIALLARTAHAGENLFAVKIQQPGVDLRLQELIRDSSTSTVQSTQRIPHSKPGNAALLQAFRELARARGAKYFRLEKPYAETVGGQIRIVHFYGYPAIFSLRRIHSAKGPTAW